MKLFLSFDYSFDSFGQIFNRSRIQWLNVYVLLPYNFYKAVGSWNFLEAKRPRHLNLVSRILRRVLGSNDHAYFQSSSSVNHHGPMVHTSWVRFPVVHIFQLSNINLREKFLSINLKSILDNRIEIKLFWQERRSTIEHCIWASKNYFHQCAVCEIFLRSKMKMCYNCLHSHYNERYWNPNKAVQL